MGMNEDFTSPGNPNHVYRLASRGYRVSGFKSTSANNLLIVTEQGATSYSADQVEIDNAKRHSRLGETLGQAIKAANIRWALDEGYPLEEG